MVEVQSGHVAEAECPRCGEEEETPDHIMLRCRRVRRVEDKRGGEWVRENGLRWDSWDALTSRKWVRMEDCIVFVARTET